MHEVGIAQSLLDIAIDNCKKQGYKGIESIKVKIGKGFRCHAGFSSFCL